MCAIVGVWHLDGRTVRPENLQRLTDALAHRGPDREGRYDDLGGSLALGHRRLAILDLTATGHQPLNYGDGRYVVVFGGEVYNFLELRRELQNHGYVFHTETDTEVIPAAYDYWGTDCQFKFNGMWAFALWDRRERTLFLSRDRFGVKPLFYVSEPGRRFAFASEMKTFLYLDDFAAVENEAAIRIALSHPFALKGTTQTLLQGVSRLQAGHCMIVRRDVVREWRWWNTLEHLTKVEGTFADQVAHFRELFDDACRLRMRSDVPVASCVSGGLDSTSVLCTVAGIQASKSATYTERVQKDPQVGFVATFPGTQTDGGHFAEIAVRHAGASLCLRPISPDEALDQLHRVIYDIEDVAWNNPVPFWILYRELRRSGIVVSLEGHGADELRLSAARRRSLKRCERLVEGASQAPRFGANLLRSTQLSEPAPGEHPPSFVS